MTLPAATIRERWNDPLRAAADRITGEIVAALDGRPLAEILLLSNSADRERK